MSDLRICRARGYIVSAQKIFLEWAESAAMITVKSQSNTMPLLRESTRERSFIFRTSTAQTPSHLTRNQSRGAKTTSSSDRTTISIVISFFLFQPPTSEIIIPTKPYRYRDSNPDHGEPDLSMSSSGLDGAGGGIISRDSVFIASVDLVGGGGFLTRALHVGYIKGEGSLETGSSVFKEMQQHLMQMQPMMAAAYYPNNVTTDHIQQYLDENKSLILKIVESQNCGKLSECAENQAKLQRNLMYLAAIADSQPQPPSLHSQYPSSTIAQPGSYYVQHQQAQPMTPQSLMAARSSMLYTQQQPYPSLHGQLSMSSGASSGLNILQSESSHSGGSGALGGGGFP
ncbi:hypothetical protein NL676_030931 [Syzygium grande]|nr:hypothetical protein NL676_030931 [Syzygium grande]